MSKSLLQSHSSLFDQPSSWYFAWYICGPLKLLAPVLFLTDHHHRLWRGFKFSYVLHYPWSEVFTIHPPNAFSCCNLSYGLPPLTILLLWWLLDHVPLAVPLFSNFQIILRRLFRFCPSSGPSTVLCTLSNNLLFYTAFVIEEIIISPSKAVSCSSLSYCVILGCVSL